MTNYTVWNGSMPSGTSSTNGGVRTNGLQFTVSQACQLTGLAYYLPAGGTTTGSSYTGLLWSTTNGTSGTLLGSQAGSGTWATGGWNWITLGTPIALSPGVTYVAGLSSADQLQFLHSYWTTGGPGVGGVTSGPITVPGAPAAVGGVQEPVVSAAGTFPNLNGTFSWYGMDIQVTVTPAAAASSGLLMAGII